MIALGSGKDGERQAAAQRLLLTLLVSCAYHAALALETPASRQHIAADLDLEAKQNHRSAQQRQLMRAEARSSADADAADNVNLRFTRTFEGDAEGSVPGLGKFSSDMEALHASEEKARVPTDPGHVKVLVGVLTRLFEQDYRDVHRKTWMRANGACAVDIQHDVAPPPGKDCRYYVTFVTGHNEKTNATMDGEIANHHDMTPLWFADNNISLGTAAPVVLHRDGTYLPLDQDSAADKAFDWIRGIKLKKSLWLRFAALHFRWATHIASADLDTFPHMDMILTDLKDPVKSPWADQSLKPPDWQDSVGGVYYGASCAGPMGFKQGAFTTISRGFLECMFQNPSLSDHLDLFLGVPRGDVIIARLVTVATKDANSTTGTCPAPWWVGPNHCAWESHWAHPV